MTQALSLPWYRWREQRPQGRDAPIRFDAVVIGSGYGGAVAALRLAQQGWQVTVLERGGEYLPGDFPNDIATAPEHLRLPTADGRAVGGRANGLFEFRAGPGLIGVMANGVGGGSLINAGVLLEPDRDVFAQEAWPAAIRNDVHELAAHFERARTVLQGFDSARLGELNKSRALHRLGRAMASPRDSQPVQITVDPDKCTACGDCASGCNVDGAKITLRHSYLRAAHEAGAQIINSATVYALRRGEHGRGWRLRVMPTQDIGHYRSVKEAALDEAQGGLGVEVHARLVVVAAGTFGSTELLQRSAALEGDRLWLSPALGSRLSANGDSLNFSTNEPDRVGAIGLGADGWQASGGRGEVGPTITRMLDLRQRVPARSASATGEPDRPPLEQRLLIEEGAVPAAIGRVFAEMIAFGHAGAQLGSTRWNTPRDSDVEPLSATDWLRPEAARNERAMVQHTQVLLTMGHDGSAGRVVWVPDRDGSVPYWERPGELQTYQYQQQVLTDAIRKLGGSWTPSPAWQLFPPSLTGLLSGPRPPQLITTVHPLGGCPMGDDPRTSVVDHLGRVWAREEGHQRVHEDLYVLDGSIVPSSLGCNPLLTITALAERAMAHAPACPREGDGPTELPQPVPAPNLAQPLSRTAAPVLPGAMEERLVCDPLPLAGAFAATWRARHAAADLQFTLDAPDWLAMWDDPHHRLVPRGRLRLEPLDGPFAGQALALYDTDAAGCTEARLLEAGSQPRPWRWVDPLPVLPRVLLRTLELAWRTQRLFCQERAHLVRVFWTWLILRGISDIRYRAPEDKSRPLWPRLCALPSQAASAFKGWLHAAEVRRMHYTVDFVRAQAADDGLPARLRLRGVKTVDYAATWSALGRWAGAALRHRLLNGPPAVLDRPSFFTQMTHMEVKLSADGARVAGPGVFCMDVQEMVQQLPLLLPKGGDLSSGLVAFAAYPGVFLRFLMKTRLFDFRRPNYSGSALRDNAPEVELALRMPDGKVLPEAVDFEVPLGVSSSDGPDVDPKRMLNLRLWRYRRPAGEAAPRFRRSRWQGRPVRKARSVLLVHAFAQSGYLYTLKSVEQNLAEALYAAGYEVWVLEHRLSTRLPAHGEQSTLDQIASFDLPKAVEVIHHELDNELGPDADAPWQIMAFAQCLGAAATMMSLLAGGLSHEVARSSRRLLRAPAQPVTPLCPKLAGLVVSQTQPFCIGTPFTQSKTWLPALLRDAAQFKAVPFGVRGAQESVAAAVMDRTFAALPVPDAERCPPRQGGDVDEDDCATCRRIRFIEAPLFKHCNLNYATHRELPRLFGEGNIRTFTHIVKCVDAERLVTEDGQASHLHDESASRHAGLPICFLHGGANELFDPESARRSAAYFARLHPRWADAAALGAGGDASRAAWIVEGYGHLDPLIAQDAHQRVYPGLVQRFDAWYALDDATAAPAPSRFAGVRLPRSGPMVGAVRRDAQGRLRVSVSFRIDDRYTDGKHGPQGHPGTRTWAFARVRFDGEPAFRRAQPMTIERMSATAALFGRDVLQDRHEVAVRTAQVDLQIDDAGVPPDAALTIECFSVHESLLAKGAGVPGDSLPMDDVLLASPPGEALELWLDELLALRARRLAELRAEDRPRRPSVSVFRRHPERFDARLAQVPAASLARLAPRGAPADDVVLGVASCRYPGFPIERERVDRWLQFATDEQVPQVHAGLLLGDQIYADATAGAADPFSPAERFLEKHRIAFERAPCEEDPPAFGDWLASLPVVLTPDDHEFADNYPDGTPLVKASPRRMAVAQARIARVARRTVEALQTRASRPLALGPGAIGFTAGPVRVLVLDTRSRRRAARTPPRAGTILRPDQWQALDGWLAAPEALTHLNLIATGCVVLPGLQLRGKPTDPGAPDTFQSCPPDRDALLGRLAAAARRSPEAFRCLLVSGDYHLSVTAALTLEGRTIGGCIVAPPLNSTLCFTNALPHDLWTDEALPHGLALAPSAGQPAIEAWVGNALGRLAVRRGVAAAGYAYEVEFSARLWVPTQFDEDSIVLRTASLRL